MPDVRAKLDALGRRWPWFGMILRVVDRFGELNGNYLASSVTLAAFLSLFPLLLVAIAILGFFASNSTDLASEVISKLGLTGNASEVLTGAIERAERSRKVASVIGLAGLLWSGLGLVAALQYAFDTCWQVKGRGMKDKLFGLGWLAGAGLIFAASFGLTAVVNVLPSFLAPLTFAIALGIDVVLWLWTMKALTNRHLEWRALLPGAFVGAVGLGVLKAVGSIYVPRAVTSANALYGTIGVVFAVLAWLLFFGRLVVYATVFNVVRWEDRHGTDTVNLEVPKVPGETPQEATRSGDAVPATPASQ